MRSRIHLCGSLLVAFGGALTAAAAPPADTNPTPGASPVAKDKDASKVKDAQKSPDARKDAPVANAPNTANAPNAPNTSNAPNTPNAPSAAVAPNAAKAQGNANAQGGANVPGNAKTQPGANAQGGIKTQAGASTGPQSQQNLPNQPVPNAPTAAGVAAQGTVNAPAAPSQANVNVQAGAAAQPNATALGAAAPQTNFATQFGTALGLGFAAATGNALTFSTVQPGSVFSSVGLLPGDQLVSIGGQSIASQAAFQQYLYSVPVGQRIPIVVTRNGVQQTMYWTPNQAFVQSLPRQSNVIAVTLPLMQFDKLGIQLDTRNQNATVVAQVADGSPAQQAGVRPGDAIVAINGQEIHGPNEFMTALNQLPPNSPVNLSLARTQTVQVGQSGPVPVTVAKPIVPPTPSAPANSRPARRIFRRN